MDNIVLVKSSCWPSGNTQGITDLYLSWGINLNVEHARTAYHKTCGTENQQPYRRRNSQTPCFNWNIAQARPMSVSNVRRSLQSWESTTHRWYSQLTFFFFLKNYFQSKVKQRQLWVRPIEWLKLNFASCVVHQTPISSRHDNSLESKILPTTTIPDTYTHTHSQLGKFFRTHNVYYWS